MIRQAQAGLIGRLHQHASIETQCSVIAGAFELAVIAPWAEWIGYHARYLSADTINSRPEPDRHLFVKRVADGRLKGQCGDFTFVGVIPSGKTTAVVGYQPERHIEPDTECPMFIDRFDVIPHRYCGGGHHVAVFLSPKRTACLADVRFGEQRRRPYAHLLSFKPRHARRVTVDGTGVFGR